MLPGREDTVTKHVIHAGKDAINAYLIYSHKTL